MIKDADDSQMVYAWYSLKKHVFYWSFRPQFPIGNIRYTRQVSENEKKLFLLMYVTFIIKDLRVKR